MKLSQPIQGSHPGDTGKSCLEYLLDGKPTVPPDLGVFLGVSYRMHPNICNFISDAIYEGRLTSFEAAQRHRIVLNLRSSLIPVETGILWYPVDHEGRAQSSEEEVEVIRLITQELRGLR